jgi:hypothetical protein
MVKPLSDVNLGQIEQRVLKALDAAASPWIAELETRAPVGGCSFIRFGDDPAVDQEIYLDVQTGHGRLTSPDVRLDSIIEFVASAPEDIMRLITEVRRLQGQSALGILFCRAECYGRECLFSFPIAVAGALHGAEHDDAVAGVDVPVEGAVAVGECAGRGGRWARAGRPGWTRVTDLLGREVFVGLAMVPSVPVGTGQELRP